MNIFPSFVGNYGNVRFVGNCDVTLLFRDVSMKRGKYASIEAYSIKVLEQI